MPRNLDEVQDGQFVVSTTVVARVTPSVLKPAARFEDRDTYRGKPPEEWTHTDLWHYVTAELERRFGKGHGRFPDAYRETATFKSYHKRWGALGVRIAIHAFADLDGWWNGRPLTISMFCKASDVHFSIPVAEKLTR